MCKNHYVQFIVWLLLLLSPNLLLTQNIQLQPPDNLSVCRPAVLQMNLQAGSGGLQNAMLAIDLPCGFSYLPGSITTLQELTLDDPGQPVFNVPDLNPDASLAFEIEVEISCTAIPCIDNGNLFFLEYQLSHSGGTLTTSSSLFNVETPQLVITQIEDIVMQGALNEVVERKITIRNTRLGSLDSFLFEDQHTSSVDITSTNGAVLQYSNELLQLQLGPADFGLIGNQDGRFDFNEEIVIVERLQAVDCALDKRKALSDIQVAWGCGGIICQSSEVNAQFEVQPFSQTGDVLTQFEETLTEPDCYLGGIAPQRIWFTRENPMQLQDFQFTIEQPVAGQSILVGSIQAAGADSIAYNQVSVNTCGDSVAASATLFFDQLPPTSGLIPVQIDWLTAYCLSSPCNPLRTSWRYLYSYRKDCAQPGDEVVTRVEQVGTTGEAIISSQLQLNADTLPPTDGDTVWINYSVSYEELTSSMGTLRFILELPGLFQLLPSDFTLDGKLPVEQQLASVNGNTQIELVYDLPFSTNPIELLLPAVINCDSAGATSCRKILVSTCEVPCIIANENQMPISAKAIITANDSCSTEGQLAACEEFVPVLNCPQDSCPDTLPGYLDYTLEVERLTLGWPDKDNDYQPDPAGQVDSNLLFWQRMGPGDTFRIKWDGSFVMDVPGYTFDHFTLELSTGPFEATGWNLAKVNADPFIDALIGLDKGIREISSVLQIYDASSGQWYSLSDPAFTYDPGQLTWFYDFSVVAIRSIAPDIPLGFRYSQGDSIRFCLTKVVQENILTTPNNQIPPPPDKPEDFSLINYPASLLFNYSSEIFLDTQAIDPAIPRSTCNCTSTQVEITGFNILSSLVNIGNEGRCPNVPYTSGLIRNLLGFALDFPTEIKPVWRPDYLQIPRQPFVIIDSIEVQYMGQSYILPPDNLQDPDYFYFSFPNNLPFPSKGLFIFGSQQFTLQLFKHNTRCLSEGNSPQEIRMYLNRNSVGEAYFPPYIVFSLPPTSATQAADQLIQLAPAIDTLISLDASVSLPIAIWNSSNNETLEAVFIRPVYGIGRLDSVQLMNPLDGQAFPNTNGYFQLDALGPNDTLEFVLTAISNSCGQERVILEYGFDCTPYDDPASTPCALKRDTIWLRFPGGLMDQLPDPLDKSADLCDTMPQTQVLVFNADLGATYNLEAGLTLPPGMEIIPGSCEIAYPAGSGSFFPIPDPQPLGNQQFQWILSNIWPALAANGLPGVNSPPGNSFEIQFQTLTNCDFISGTRIIHTIQAEQVCGIITNRVAKVSTPYHIEGLSPPFTTNLNATLSGKASCADSINVALQWTQPLDSSSRLQVVLPPGIQYLPGTASSNFSPLEPTQEDGKLVWFVQPTATETQLDFTLIAEPEAECANQILPIFLSVPTQALCTTTNTVCDIEAVAAQANLPLLIEKTTYAITTLRYLSTTDTSQPVALEVGVTNQESPQGDTVWAALYWDVNGDQMPGMGDSLLQVFPIGGVGQVGDTALAKLDLPALPRNQYCHLLIALRTEDNCICSPVIAPVEGALSQPTQAAELCWNDTLLVGVDPLPGFQYQWNTNQGLNCTQCPQALFFEENTSLSPISWSLQLQESSPQGCILIHPFELTVYPKPELFANQETICRGDTLQVLAPLGSEYQWQGSNIVVGDEQVLVATPDSHAVYQLNMQDPIGCAFQSVVSVDVLDAPGFAGATTQSFCFGAAAQIQGSAQPGVMYNWLNGQGQLSNLSIPNPTILIDTPFTYLLEVSNDDCVRILPVEVDFFPAFTINLPSDTLTACQGDTLFGTLDSMYNYTWEGAVTPDCLNDSCYQWRLVTDFDVLLLLTATDSQGCKVTDSLAVQALVDSVTPIEELSLCEGDSIQVFGQWVSEAGLYCDTFEISGSCRQISCRSLSLFPTWAFQDTAALCPGESLVFAGDTLDQPGLYCQTLSSVHGCDSTLCLELKEKAHPTLGNLPDTLRGCTGDSLLLVPEGALTYQWLPDSIVNCLTPNCDSLWIPLPNEPQILTVIGTAENECTDQDSLVVSGVQTKELEETSTELCESDSLELFGQWVSEAGSYCDTLSIGSGCQFIECVHVSLLPEIRQDTAQVLCPGDSIDFFGESLNTAGTYCRQFQTSNGCDSSVCIALSFSQAPDLGLLSGPFDIQAGDSVWLEAPPGYATYQWQPPTWLSCPDCQATWAFPSTDTLFFLEVTDSIGCLTVQPISVVVLRTDNCLAVDGPLPNAFSPNGDLANDVFFIPGLEFCGPVRFIVFNRWGQEVYREDLFDNAWEGLSHNGQSLPQSTYYIVVEFLDFRVIRKGMVDLRRE